MLDISRGFAIECFICECRAYSITDDPEIATRDFFERGWRDIQGKTECPCCAETGCDVGCDECKYAPEMQPEHRQFPREIGDVVGNRAK